MSNYSKTTDFEAKDSLPTGDSGKIIRGAEFETEFDAISTAIATKADTAGPTFTGTLTFETISDGTIGVTAFVDEDDMSSDSATLVPTQQSVKAYVDSQVTAQDLDFQADSGGALSIDLDSETLTFTGGTGIDTSGSGNAVTFAIDSTVATLTGTQTLTNKTLTSPDVNTPDIDGGTIDGTVIGGTTPAAVSATTVSATGNITVGGTVDGRDVATDGTKLDGIESGATADQTAAEIRTLVESATDSNVFTDADHTKLDGIEAGATGDQTNAEIRAAVEAATDSNVFTDADHSKLDGIEAGADVTDTANVTAAGALMDSEVTNLDQVKAFDSADYATAAQGSTADSALQNVVEDTTPQLGGDLASNGNDILFADNDKAIFGAGSDLQIYHDGAVSRISSSGTPLRITNGVDAIQLRASTLQLQDNSGYDYITTADNGNGGTVRLFYNSSEVLETTSTGIDVTGKVVSDGLDTSEDLIIRHSTTDHLQSILGTDGGGFAIEDNNYFAIWHQDIANVGTDTGLTQRFQIATNGDISFYEDTGTTAKLFWDASAESLGIGTDSPADKAHVNGGNVQIQNSNASLILTDSGNSNYKWLLQSISSGLRFYNSSGSSEAMRIDSSGNLLVSGTSSSIDAGSISLEAQGRIRAGRDGGAVMQLNRTTSDGDVAVFYKDSVSVGSIASVGGADIKVVFSGDGDQYITGNSASNYLSFNSANAERMRIDSSGNVGIGTSSIGTNDRLIVKTAVDNAVDQGLVIQRSANSDEGYINYNGGAFRIVATDGDPIRLGHVSSADRVSIDASGNLLVGTTDSSVYNNSGSGAGINLQNFGNIAVARDGNDCMVLNRLNSDGAILNIAKDGSTVGIIGSDSTDLFIGTGDTGIRFNDAVNGVLPYNTSTGQTDATLDLGYSSVRWKDLYLSGGAYLGGVASANLLDDYEEGTWTPAPTSGTLNAGATGSYVKIGSLVHVQGQLSFSANGTTNRIDGLPFRPRIEATLSSARQRFLIYSDSTTAIYGYCQDVNNALHFQNEDRTAHDFDTADGVYTFAFTYET